MQILSYILLGIITGVIGGAFGIGGGTVMIPAFVFLFGLSQHQAQGTSLAVMALPIFLLAAYRYYLAGNVHLKMAVFVACGFVLGSVIGANVVQQIPGPTLKKVFGCLLIVLGMKMVLLK